MDEMPVNEFIEMRGGGYYLVGSRISLDTIAYCLRHGDTVDDILEGFPSLERHEVERVIAYIRMHQAAVDAYLKREEQRYEELRKQNPPPASVLEKIRKYREERGLKSA
jgi:uncharacterized protein (DUF433 family)